MQIDIRPATLDDLPDVLSVLDEASAWLQSIGITRQWPATFSDHPVWSPRITALTVDRQMYLVKSGFDAIGTFHLRDEPERYETPNQVWPNELRDRPSRYLYLLAVRRRVAGHGVAVSILDGAAESAHHDARVLRLDCWAGNDKLRRFYAGAGFEYLGDIEIQDEAGRTFGCSRFQRSE